MGLFFDDDKEEVKVTTPPPQQSNGFFAVVGIAIVTFVLAVLTWILKPLFTYLFDFKDVSRDLALIKISVIAVIFIGGPLALYMYVPFVRDLVSLRDTHTLNFSKYGTRITFPDRSYFKPEGMRRGLNDGNGRTYATFAGYTKRVAQKVDSNVCQMIPRSETMAVASLHPPVQAEGFESEVEYPLFISIYGLPFWRYTLKIASSPDYWFKDKDYLRTIRVTYQKTALWGEFLDDWDSIESFSDGYKPFEVKALAMEHAVICF